MYHVPLKYWIFDYLIICKVCWLQSKQCRPWQTCSCKWEPIHMYCRREIRKKTAIVFGWKTSYLEFCRPLLGSLICFYTFLRLFGIRLTWLYHQMPGVAMISQIKISPLRIICACPDSSTRSPRIVTVISPPRAEHWRAEIQVTRIRNCHSKVPYLPNKP